MQMIFAACLTAQLQIIGPSLLLAADVIRAGDKITRENTEAESGDMTAEDKALIGREVRRTVYPGKRILPDNTRAPRLVMRNQIVLVKYVSAGLEISLTGRAMDQAGAGDYVSVMNTQSRKLITGYVTEEGWILAK